MSFVLQVGVSGIDELDRALGSLARAEYRTRALRRCAEEVARAARGSFRQTGGDPAPDRLTSRTGELEGSIRISEDDRPRSVAVGTDLFWARFHEEGLGRFRKRAFLAPALESSAAGFRALFEQEIAAEIARLGLA